VSILCELLAIVVNFMLRSPILVSESTSENLTGAQGESPKFRSGGLVAPPRSMSKLVRVLFSWVSFYVGLQADKEVSK